MAAESSTQSPEPSEADIERAWADPKLANVLYHDWESATYDEKWSISYDQRCIDYARDRFTAIAGTGGWPYGEALELGSGTGFFLLNLMQAGVVTKGQVTDLSPGMVETAIGNARALGSRLAESSRAQVLESVVDQHTFDPGALARTALRAGAVDVRTATEELTAAFLGWPVRTFEAAVNPDRLGWGWAMFAFRSWQRLSVVDRALGKVLPQGLFYSLLVTGTRPL